MVNSLDDVRLAVTERRVVEFPLSLPLKMTAPFPTRRSRVTVRQPQLLVLPSFTKSTRQEHNLPSAYKPTWMHNVRHQNPIHSWVVPTMTRASRAAPSEPLCCQIIASRTPHRRATLPYPWSNANFIRRNNVANNHNLFLIIASFTRLVTWDFVCPIHTCKTTAVTGRTDPYSLDARMVVP